MQVMPGFPFCFICKTNTASHHGDKSLIGIQMRIGIVSPVNRVIDRDCT